MPATGIEPVLCCHNRILSPARLPVPPRRHVNNNGQRRIRTFEGSASRFTVCPLWPLGNLPIKADERTRTVNLLITNQLLCQLSHIGIWNLIACRSKTLFSRSRCNRLYDENINLTLMQAFVRLMFPSCTQSLFRENWATSAYEFLSDSKGIWTPVTAVKGRCLNRLTMEPCFLSLSLFVFFLFFLSLPRLSHLFFNAKKLPE